MKRFLFPVSLFIYVNLTWQTMIWGGEFFFSIGKIILFFFFPVAFATGLFLFFEVKLNDQRSYFFLAAGILMIAFFGLGNYGTRNSDYIKFLYGNEGLFSGEVSEINDKPYLFYTISGFSIKSLNEKEFGVSYSSLSRKNSTTYSKHFAIPVFAEKDSTFPKLWLCSTYSSGSLKPDNHTFSIYGFSETALSKSLNVSIINGKKHIDKDCEQAVYQYLQKKNIEMIASPLTLNLVTETADQFYQSSKKHFWILIVLLNILFFGIPAFALPKETKKNLIYEH